MNQSIKPGLVPPARNLEKEEPEQGYEDDIPSDDSEQMSKPAATGRVDPDKDSTEQR